MASETVPAVAGSKPPAPARGAVDETLTGDQPAAAMPARSSAAKPSEASPDPRPPTISSTDASAPSRSRPPGDVSGRTSAGSWRDPWWHPAIGFPFYVLGGLLILAGFGAGLDSVIVNGLEVVGIGLVAADAWNVRAAVPLINSSRKRVAILGWLIIALVAIGIALLVPVV